MICEDSQSLAAGAANGTFVRVEQSVADTFATDAQYLQSLGIKSGKQQLPLYSMTAKLHKSPVADCFLPLS